MLSDSSHSSGTQTGAQQRFLSYFLRSEREVFLYVAALVPNVADAEDIVQQTALALWEKSDAYRLGPAELGNWNPGEFPNKPPFLIRHFSGVMDEFALFSRALNDAEIRPLYVDGAPQPEPGRMASGRELRE